MQRKTKVQNQFLPHLLYEQSANTTAEAKSCFQYLGVISLATMCCVFRAIFLLLMGLSCSWAMPLGSVIDLPLLALDLVFTTNSTNAALASMVYSWWCVSM